MNDEEKILYVYHSNQLSEITLSLEQTRQIIREDIKSIDTEEMMAPDGESFEVANVQSHLRALNFVLGFPTFKKMDLPILKSLHSRLMEGVILSRGEFRECNMRLKGIQPFPFQRITPTLEQLCQIMEHGMSNPPEDKEHFAWIVHHEFSLIHPFIDGNGRMSRLLYNLMRKKFGLPLNIVNSDEKTYYLRTIQDYQKYKLRQVQKQTQSS